jgi:bacteriocin biosynthesis cyclodehydratase domain-containing protein
MAAAHGVEPVMNAEPPALAPATFSLTSLDPAGAAFAAAFTRLLRDDGALTARHPVAVGAPAAGSPAGHVLIVAGSSQMLDPARHAGCGGSWMPVIQDAGKWWAGPVISPAGRPCALCYQGRRHQHSEPRPPGPEPVRALPSDEAAGTSPGVLAVVAGLAAWIARPASRGGQPASGQDQIAICDEVTGAFRLHRLWPVPGCPGCGTDAAGTARPGQEQRGASLLAGAAGAR